MFCKWLYGFYVNRAAQYSRFYGPKPVQYLYNKCLTKYYQNPG